MEKTDRITARQQESSVSFAKRMLQRSVTNAASIKEQILHPIVASAMRRIRDEALQLDLFISANNFDETLCNRFAVKCRDALPQIFDRRQVMDQSAPMS